MPVDLKKNTKMLTSQEASDIQYVTVASDIRGFLLHFHNFKLLPLFIFLQD